MQEKEEDTEELVERVVLVYTCTCLFHVYNPYSY